MMNIEHKNNLPNYSEEKDIDYQEIEKTTFLIENELKDFKELIYLTSSINKKYTALLYCDKEQSYLYLFILRHIIDSKKENISYKIKSKLIFNKSDIDKTNLDEKQMFIDEQANKNVKNEYKIFLINQDLILLQVTGKKIIVINFDKKEYVVLFSNNNDKKVIQVVDTYDELIVLKNEQKSNKTKKKIYKIRTYVFCIASGVLYFFILNDKIFTDLQFLLIPFPFEGEIKDCIDFKLLKINNKSTELIDFTEKKYYFMMIALLNGKLVRYITHLNNKSLKEILLKFKENLKNNFIKKNVDIFERGINNISNYKLKIYRCEKCASFIILQIDFHIFTFKFYESDSPDDIIKRLEAGSSNDFSNILELSNNLANNSSENLNLKTNKNETEMTSEMNILGSNGRNISQISLNDMNSQSRAKASVNLRRHMSVNALIIPSQIKDAVKFNSQINNESIISTNNIHNTSIDQPETTLTLTDANVSSELISNANNNINNNQNNNNSQNINSPSSDKNLIIPELKTKDRDVVYYSLYNLHNFDLNEEKEKKEKEKENNNMDIDEENKDNIETKNQNENQIKKDTYKNIEEILRNIKYSFTFNSFISFIKEKNSVIVCYIQDKLKDYNDIEKVTKYNRKLFINSKENIQILDILHYDQSKYSFLLTNNFIYKFRVNPDLLHLLNISKHKTVSEDPKREVIYYKLNHIFKYSRTHKISNSEKCKLCKKPESKLICPKCNRAVYCCKEHMEDDFINIHFFQCEMNVCLSKLILDRKKNDLLVDFNNVIISFKNILNQIFILIENKKDYMNYSMYLKIMLNVLEYIKIEQFMNSVLTPMRSSLTNDFRQVCDKIFIIELWFFYLNLNILYIDFIIKSEMYYLASKLVNKVKIADLIENKDTKLQTMFAYFALSNDLTKYKITHIKEIEEYSKKFFFDLLEIYTNGNKKGNYLYIHEQFFRYYLYSFCSMLKINLFLKEKTKTLKEITPINIAKIVYHIPILFEEKINNSENNTTSEIRLKLPLILLYYYLSFILVKIDKVSTAIYLLRYILEELKKINNKKDANKNNNESLISTYFSLEAKINLNIGLLVTYNGNFNLGIHYLENCYRLCFEKKLSTSLTIKILYLLGLAYINYDKIDTAFILLKSGINLTKKFLAVKKNFNSTILINKLSLFKLKLYLLFLYQYISYKYQKMNKLLNTKTKGKNNIIKDPDDIPTSIFPLPFNKMSPALIGYVCEEDKNIKLADCFKEKINKEDESFKFELDSNLDKFVLFCNNYKFDMIIKALEFLYKLSDKEYDILNSDNGAMQKDEAKEDNNNNLNTQKERSSFMSRDSSLSYSRSIINKEKLHFNLKEDNENFFDEIEVKIGLYDTLSDLQQKELKSIQNNIFRRSILLRDPKGKIDKFNLNYHPKYTFDFYELFTKMSETIFLNQLEKFGISEQYEAKIFENNNDGLIHSLRRYLNLEKIQNILYMEKVKLIEKNKNNIIFIQRNERRETVTKNQTGFVEYMNKLKEKLGKDKFLKNMNMDGLLEKLLKDLTYRELDYIVENPNKIFNYIFINTKPFSEEQNSGINNQTNKEQENNEKKYSENISNIINKNQLNKKKKNSKEKEDKKVKLSPRAIYNNLVDLVSDKKKERTGKKKQTVNFKNVNLNDILNSSKTKDENLTYSRAKNEGKEVVKKTSINRSITLNKQTISSFKSKSKNKITDFHSLPNNKKSPKSEKQYMMKSSLGKKKNIKISEFKPMSDLRKFSSKSSLSLIYENDINSFNNTKKSNKILSKIIPEMKIEKEDLKQQKESMLKSFISKKVNILNNQSQKINTKKDVFIFEENITQQKDIDNNEKSRNVSRKETKNNLNSLLNIKTSQENSKEDYILNDTEYIKNKIDNTFLKYKNKNLNKNLNINKTLNENEINDKPNIERSKSKERKVTYVLRNKPTFKELREKVLHRSNTTSVSTLY